ncbi:DUF4231 domain-containing protein [Methylobacter luteus]|uniref:DUF4231 domain-containing protein n=1 Tax=Methylobacter luteus TaxID=415 RepID=UPI0004834300|nr:DUF4231 domain-containing protein [Methylobacter luteus]
MDAWKIGIVVYLITLIATFLPVAKAIARKVELKPGGEGFQESSHFDEKHKKLLLQHYSRIQGTLGYWKNLAELYKSLHYYLLLWTIPSAVVIPVLTPFIVDSNFSKEAVTILSAITAVLLAFHQGLKVEDNLKAFRHGESEFYDLMRRLLDRPNSLGKTQSEQIDAYFEEVARIRRFVRNAETDNLGTLDDARTELEKRRAEGGGT